MQLLLHRRLDQRLELRLAGRPALPVLHPGEELEDRAHERVEVALGEAGPRRELARQRLPELLPHDAVHQGVLVDEVGVEGGPVHRGAFGDVLHRDRAEAALGD